MAINAMSLAVFTVINLLTALMKKARERIVKTTLLILLGILFLGNLFRYLYAYPILVGERHIPIEYSTTAYFLVPIFMCWNFKNSRTWAAVYGFIAGLMYYLTMIVAGGHLYEGAPLYDILISYFCHGVLYVNGVIALSRRHVSDRDWAKTMLCLLIISARALVLRKYAIDADELFIYDVLLGDVIRMVTPSAAWNISVPIYYVALNLLIILSLRGFLPDQSRLRRHLSLKKHNASDENAQTRR